jgi:cell wall-associated NlpC family hydrolase
MIKHYASISVLLLVLISVAVVFDGCVSSSPRFGTTPKTKKEPTTPATKDGAKDSGSKPSGKTKTDTAPDETGKSGRDYRTEKNKAIKPLDESKMMRQISKYMGVPYKLGGESIEGMDCSGYTMTVYEASIGVKLPRTSGEQSKLGTDVRFEELKFGDLVFFNTTGERASHVGIYLGDDLFAHASVTQGVTISSLQSSYYRDRYESARRIIDQ